MPGGVFFCPGETWFLRIAKRRLHGHECIDDAFSNFRREIDMKWFRTDGSKEIWNLLMDNRTLESPLTADFAKFQLSPGFLRRRGRKQKGTRLVCAKAGAGVDAMPTGAPAILLWSGQRWSRNEIMFGGRGPELPCSLQFLT